MLLYDIRPDRGTPCGGDRSHAALACLRAEDPAAARMLDARDGAALRFGAQTHWFRGGEACLGPLLTHLRAARTRIWLALADAGPGVVWDTVLTILRRHAARGADVRLLLGPRCLLPGLRALGDMRIRWTRRGLRPAGMNAILIDADVCYAGAIALRDDWAGLRSSQTPWLAPCLRLEGGAVEVFAARFAALWQAAAGQALPDTPPAEGSGGYCYVLPLADGQALRTAVLRMIQRAERSVWLLTPEPGPALGRALRLTARSGVEVRILCARGRLSPDLCASACDGVRVCGMACCVDGTAAAVGDRGGGLWIYGDGAEGLGEMLACLAVH